MNVHDMIPLAPLLVSLGMLATLIFGAWKVRDLVASRAELHEVRECIEKCARKEDLESLRATLNLHISQASTAIHELRIDIGRLDERAQSRWEKVLNKLSSLSKSDS